MDLFVETFSKSAYEQHLTKGKLHVDVDANIALICRLVHEGSSVAVPRHGWIYIRIEDE